MMDRRSFLSGLIAAPAIIKTVGLIMPVKEIVIRPLPITNGGIGLVDFRKIVDDAFGDMFDKLYEERKDEWKNVFKGELQS